MSGARTSFYRPTGQSRRAVRNQQQYDHDVFEGLPIRRWGKSWLWIAKKNPPPPAKPELPLPKDTHLLTPMSQTLLKAARNGTLGQTQQAENGELPPEEVGEDGEPIVPKGNTRLFQTNKWTVTAREDEPAEVEYLGRQPDTFSRKSRLVKKTVSGKVVIVEEEIEDLFPDVVAAAPGVAAGVAAIAADGTPLAAAQPVKRRPPPPKKKTGRGRKPGFKKMVTFAEDGRAMPTGEGVAGTPSGAAGSGADTGDGEGEGEGEGDGDDGDDVEMGDADDGTPDHHDDDGDGDGEGDDVETTSEVEGTPGASATPAPSIGGSSLRNELKVEIPEVKKEGTVEPMAISPPPTSAAAPAEPVPEKDIPVVEEPPKPESEPIVTEKVKSPTPAAVLSPVAVEEVKAPTPKAPTPREATPKALTPKPLTPRAATPKEPSPAPKEATLVPKLEPSPTPAPLEAAKEPSPVPATVQKTPTPPPAPVVEEAPAPVEKVPTPIASAVASPPPFNPLKRKSPFGDEGNEDAAPLVDKELATHEVSIAAAVAERESHDEVLSPLGGAPKPVEAEMVVEKPEEPIEETPVEKLEEKKEEKPEEKQEEKPEEKDQDAMDTAADVPVVTSPKPAA